MGGKETPRQAVEAVWSYLQTEFPGWPLRDGGSHPARGGRIFGIGSKSIWVSDGFFDADTDQSPPRQRLRRWDLAAAIRDAGSDTHTRVHWTMLQVSMRGRKGVRRPWPLKCDARQVIRDFKEAVTRLTTQPGR